MTINFACPGCGRQLQVGDEYSGRRSKCPGCARVSRAPDGDAPDQRAAIQEQPLLREVEGTVGAYNVPEASPRCPSCQKVLPRRAVLCVDCGYDLRTGTRLDTVAEPFEARWSTGLPLNLRIALLVALECFCLPAGLFAGDRLSTAAFVFACSVFLVLLLGSYLKIHLVRTSKGKLLLTTTWCLCFIPAIRRQTNLRRYQIALIDATNGFGLVGWAVFVGFSLLLLSMGVLPGVLWWIWAFSHSNYHLILKGEHGGEFFTVYRGWDEARMREIVNALEEVAPFRIERR